jgi:hypothetical protein
MTEELLNALKVIKAECEKYKHCDGCPMTTKYGDCGVQEDAPKNWRLEKREVYF